MHREIEMTRVATEVARVLDALLSERSGRPEWVQRYISQYAAAHDPRLLARYYRDLLNLAGRSPGGAAVFDAGCGLGIGLVVCGLHGARPLCGIDALPELIDAARHYSRVLPAGVQLELSHGDVADTGYPERSFDLVVCNEALSHFHDVDAFLKEARRLLRPGGKLVVADGNNGLNVKVRRCNLDLWEAAETGVRRGQAEEHTLSAPYIVIRRRIIRESLPGLGEDEVGELARATSGMTRPEVIEAARRYMTTGIRPSANYRRGQPAVDPESGQVLERMFDPFQLGRQIEEMGFDATVRGHWGGARGNPLVRAANRALEPTSRLTIATAGAFWIAATRLPD